MIHLDTHVLVWLFAGLRSRIPPAAQRRLEIEPVAISPMVELELAYLWEVDRIDARPGEVLGELVPALEIAVSSAPFASVIRAAAGMRWTRDPFDRIIAAQAVVDRAALLTADGTMLANLPAAVWDRP